MDRFALHEHSNEALLARICEIAVAAGHEILRIRNHGYETRRKADSSPVTDADEAAERIIVPALEALTPEIPIVAEEATAGGKKPETGARFWLVDPLDGTKEFLRPSDDFTVNIALVEDGTAILGVVVAPALGLTYAASGPGTATLREGDGPPRPIRARAMGADGAAIVSSRSHAEPERLAAFSQSLKIKSVDQRGSSIKFCLVASGEADVYPCFGHTMEWDTAAGHAVLTGAGGSVRTMAGNELRYGKEGLKNPEFVARGRDA